MDPSCHWSCWEDGRGKIGHGCGFSSDDEFEIWERPQKTTFGLFGGAPAKVRAYIDEPDPVEERDPAKRPPVT